MDLYESCESGNEERVLELLLGGVDRPDARLEGGRTALHAACIEGQVNVVHLLLGESAEVFFTSRSMDETTALLSPLVEWKGAVQNLRMAVKADNGVGAGAGVGVGVGAEADDVVAVAMPMSMPMPMAVPVATVRVHPHCTIPNRQLLDGRSFLDDFGNSPLQCVSCFGCGSSESHLDDALEITRQLLEHGDQPNLPKYANQWTPLHWTAFNGFHEATAMLLDPPSCILSSAAGSDATSVRFTKTQFSAPMLTNREGLFAADVAGRQALKMAARMLQLQRKQQTDQPLSELDKWTLRLDHLQVLRTLVDEFLSCRGDLKLYVKRMNERVPWELAPHNKALRRLHHFTAHDAVRYGQHLLYWMGSFGCVDQVQALLTMQFTTGVDKDNKSVGGSLNPLYLCCCEEHKRQSVLHAVCARGQVEICALLLARVLQDHPKPNKEALEASQHVKLGAAWRRLHSRLAKTSSLVLPNLRDARRTSKDAKDASNVVPVAVVAAPPVPASTEEAIAHTLQVDASLLEWVNHREETPLFLACLHFQKDVVAVFKKWLTPQSLNWELSCVNVEGAAIQRVANAEICRLLEIPIPSASCREEYVLIFNGDRKKQFKESVIDTLQEESAQSPSLLVTRAGVQKYFSHWTCRFYKNDYIVVGVSERVLFHHAETLQLKIKHRDSSVRSRYQCAKHDLFEPFHSLQRQQVVFDVIKKSVNLKKHLANGNLLEIFPLHEANGCRNIVRLWIFNDRTRGRVLQPFCKKTLRQFLTESRVHQYELLWPLLTYFGEKHAFYFAFMAFFSVWLLFIAVPGLALELGGQNHPMVKTLFAIWVALWASVVVEGWKRKKSELLTNFGSFERTKTEENADFYGDFRVVKANSSGRTQIEIYFPKSVQLLRIYSGVPVLLVMAALVVLLFYYSNSSAQDLQEKLFAGWCNDQLLPYTVPFLNALLILLLDSIYSRLALLITSWENHRTVWQYESQLANKLFWFKFLNAFMSLFWIAFVRQNAVELRQQLIVIMSMRQLSNTFFRYILPMLLVKLRWFLAGFHMDSQQHQWLCFEWFSVVASRSSKPKEKATNASRVLPDVRDDNEQPLLTSSQTTPSQTVPSHILVQQLMEAPDFLLSKQLEMILQFGYVTMFVSVLPVAPFLALTFNVLNMRLDVLCSTQVKRRSPFESETEISSFVHILEFMSFAAVSVNCAVLFFTTRDFENLFVAAEASTLSTVTKVWLLVALEHLILGTKALIALTLDDSASWVLNDQSKQREAIEEEDATEDPITVPITRETIGVGHSSPTPSPPASSSGSAFKPPVALQLPSDGSTSVLKSDSQVDDFLASLLAQPAIVEQRLGVTAQENWLKQLAQLQQERQTAINQRNETHRKLLRLEEQLVELKLLVPPPKDHSNLYVDNESSHCVQKPTSPREERAKAVSSLCCFMCDLLRALAATPTRKCLDCHVWLCLSCDEVLHWDEVGGLSMTAMHFRVQVPSTYLSEHLEAPSRAHGGTDSSTDATKDKELARIKSLLLPPFDASDELLSRCRHLSVSELQLVSRFLLNFRHFPFPNESI